MDVCGHYSAWCCRLLVIWAVCLLALAVLTVDGIRCHVCDGGNNNELCNSRIAECTDRGHDACYTRLQRPDTNVKRYTKGCTNYADCRKQQDLNDEESCRLSNSDCYYCCNKKSNCNAYNTAQTLSGRSQWHLVLAGNLLFSLACRQVWTLNLEFS